MFSLEKYEPELETQCVTYFMSYDTFKTHFMIKKIN